jgi:hypothetical protein
MRRIPGRLMEFGAAARVASDEAIIVHLGVPRTGSTSFQASLARGTVEGVLLPSTGVNSMGAAHSVVEWLRDDSASGESCLDEMRQELECLSGRVILSSEAMISLGEEEVSRFIQYLPQAKQLELIVAVRDSFPLVLSTYSQWVGDGLALSFPEARPHLWAHARSVLISGLERWARVSMASSLTILRYHEGVNADDWVETLSIAAGGHHNAVPKVFGSSASAERVTLWLEMNRLILDFLPKMNRPAVPHSICHVLRAKLDPLLEEVHSRPISTLAEDEDRLAGQVLDLEVLELVQSLEREPHVSVVW